jgi:hypothetical protein
MFDIESAPSRREVEDTTSVKAAINCDEFNCPRNRRQENCDDEQADRPASHLGLTAASVA